MFMNYCEAESTATATERLHYTQTKSELKIRSPLACLILCAIRDARAYRIAEQAVDAELFNSMALRYLTWKLRYAAAAAVLSAYAAIPNVRFVFERLQ